MSGKLTTHVLDTANGCPAAGLTIELWQIQTILEQEQPLSAKTLLKTLVTNADGRTETPLLTDSAFTPGIYELHFAVGTYFASRISDLPNPPFLDVVPLRFGIADAAIHYHVPLLCSPWSYSTYRGS
ncbi:MAG: hydroxyisourate hydrolase [Phormidesmis sp. RL_2_1]|nr:hydroxyisourate hydrolase [Phormidesmis sp. RL_2_1]